jgi:CDP-4-dehydro-6-deoxyglucose reductase, E3
MNPSHPAVDRPFRVIEATALTDSVWRVVLLSADGTPFHYQEGQFVGVHLPDGTRRCYSMADPCSGDGRIALNIRLVHAGHFSGWLTGGNRLGADLMVSGPFGDCVWQEQGARLAPVLMLGTGTGIAPLKAMLERALGGGETRPITLYWGAQQERDLYLGKHFHALARDHANFRFVPTLAAAPVTWRGRRGFVQTAAAEDHPDLRDATVYACGSPLMVDDARALLVGRNKLPPTRFLADAFVPASRPPAETPAAPTLNLRVSDAHRQQRVLPAATGRTLMQVLAGAGLLTGVCGGQAACGTCRVRISSPWREQLAPPERKEARLLHALDSLPEHRLACQITVTNDLDGALVHCA